MAKYKVGGTSVFRVDASVGGTLINMSAYLDSFSGVGPEFMQLDVTAFTDTAERPFPGIQTAQEVTIRGPFDDTATGPDIVFSSLAGTIASWEWNPAGTVSSRRKFSGEAYFKSYKILSDAKGLVGYEAVMVVENGVTIGAN
jgi:hypothetical protein